MKFVLAYWYMRSGKKILAKRKLCTNDYRYVMMYFLKAVQYLPASPEAWCLLGFSKYHQGMYDEAYADYVKAIALKPDYADAYKKRGMLKYITSGFPESRFTKADACADWQKAGELGDAEAFTFLREYGE
jgi:tetratricopeptide (TPR) repeat protein